MLSALCHQAQEMKVENNVIFLAWLQSVTIFLPDMTGWHLLLRELGSGVNPGVWLFNRPVKS